MQTLGLSLESIPAAEHPDAMVPSVIVVDDENGVRDLMGRWLQSGGYSVSSASGAVEALRVMHDCRPAVALCDIRMPGHDGLWLADRIHEDFPETAVIIATGVPDAGAAARGHAGVVDCLTKPFGRERLRDAVVRGIEWHRSARDARHWRDRLEAEVGARRSRLSEAIAAIGLDSDTMVDAMLSMVTFDNPHAYSHARRVAALAARIAELLGHSDDGVALVRRAAMLHDLGKLAMPHAILTKPAPLTPEELSIMRSYPQVGAELLEGVSFLEKAAHIVGAIQERPDGGGYPYGRAGDEIPRAARIIAVADAHDTMVRPRVFRGMRSSQEALAELARCSGTQFDPAVVQTLVRMLEAN